MCVSITVGRRSSGGGGVQRKMEGGGEKGLTGTAEMTLSDAHVLFVFFSIDHAE